MTSTRRKPTKKPSKNTQQDDEIIFDSGGLLDDMGLSDDENKVQKKSKKKVTVDEDEDIKPALATLDKFIGKSSKADNAKPGRKLTNLDKLLKKAEEGSKDEEAQGGTLVLLR